MRPASWGRDEVHGPSMRWGPGPGEGGTSTSLGREQRQSGSYGQGGFLGLLRTRGGKVIPIVLLKKSEVTLQEEGRGRGLEARGERDGCELVLLETGKGNSIQHRFLVFHPATVLVSSNWVFLQGYFWVSR